MSNVLDPNDLPLKQLLNIYQPKEGGDTRKLSKPYQAARNERAESRTQVFMEPTGAFERDVDIHAEINSLLIKVVQDIK
ncbi:MAG: hypothetical protein ACFCUJ_06945 [Thiotrichales bacterium]